MNAPYADVPEILVVDDDPALLRLMQLRLEGAGLRVRVADSGERALALLAVNRPRVVVTDLLMPGMDGMALFDAIRVENPALPVIILTAHGSIPEAVSAVKGGVFGFLSKPFDAPTLLTEIERALGAAGIPAGPAADSQAWRAAILTRNPVMEEVLAKARLVASADAPVLIYGDSGTGKELLARAIHAASPRASGPFVAINCGAMPEALLESELFGHVRGAFTGAVRDHRGLLAEADGGTLLLDEIGDMPPALQVKLLRVLQEQQVRPVGSVHHLPVNVRIVSATHRDLDQAREQGRFREDLYYRLNVVNLRLPPLSARREDIPLLAAHFVRDLGRRYDKRLTGLTPESVELLLRAPWPGNVRQLYNVVEQAVALATTPWISASLVRQAIQREQFEYEPFEEARHRFERGYLARLLKLTAGNVTQAARLARRNRTEFYKLLHRHQLDARLFKSLRG